MRTAEEIAESLVAIKTDPDATAWQWIDFFGSEIGRTYHRESIDIRFGVITQGLIKTINEARQEMIVCGMGDCPVSEDAVDWVMSDLTGGGHAVMVRYIDYLHSRIAFLSHERAVEEVWKEGFEAGKNAVCKEEISNSKLSSQLEVLNRSLEQVRKGQCDE